MTDQTPPTSPDPEESSPPPAPTPAENSADSTAEPAPPVEKRSSGRSKLVAIVAGVLVLALVAGGLGAFFLTRGRSHKIVTPTKAGSLERDTATEKTLAAQLKLAEKQFRGQGNGKNIDYVKIAVYKEPGSTGNEGSLALLAAKLKKEESPSEWLKEGLTRLAKANNLKVGKVSPGEGGGDALCATQTTPPETAVCAWATTDTRVELVPISGSFDAKKLAKIMRELRGDVERSE